MTFIVKHFIENIRSDNGNVEAKKILVKMKEIAILSLGHTAFTAA